MRYIISSILLFGLLYYPAKASDCPNALVRDIPISVSGQRAVTNANINGKDVHLILDTGTSFGAMSRATAETLNLKREPAPPGLHPAGIGGSFAVEIARVENFSFLGLNLHNVPFMVGGRETGMALIGADLLDVVDADVDLAHDRFRQLKFAACRSAVSAYLPLVSEYHIADLRIASNASDRRSFVTILINEKPVNALLDSGTPSTVISRRAAERVGIDLRPQIAEVGQVIVGVGSTISRTWIAPVGTIDIGGEIIKGNSIRVVDGEISNKSNGPEMLLGIDFFLSHHLIILTSSHKLYLLQNSQHVFTPEKSKR